MRKVAYTYNSPPHPGMAARVSPWKPEVAGMKLIPEKKVNWCTLIYAGNQGRESETQEAPRTKCTPMMAFLLRTGAET